MESTSESFSREENRPRRSPPPLVSMDGTRRDSLVGLQRLVYSSQIFSHHSRTVHEDVRPIANIGENVVDAKPGLITIFLSLKNCSYSGVVMDISC